LLIIELKILRGDDELLLFVVLASEIVFATWKEFNSGLGLLVLIFCFDLFDITLFIASNGNTAIVRPLYSAATPTQWIFVVFFDEKLAVIFFVFRIQGYLAVLKSYVGWPNGSTCT